MEQTILSGDERREKLLALLLRSDEPFKRAFNRIDATWLYV